MVLTVFILSCKGTDSVFVANPQLVPEQEVTTLEIGAQAPDFSLPDVSGRFYTLGDFDDSDILVIIFTCNHCPTAQAYEDRIIQFTDDYKDKGVAVVAISPNSILGGTPEELGYTELDDSYESMIIRAKDKNFNFPYLYDGDNEAVSIQYGPVATPHAFVFNKERKLVYVGRIDASEKIGTANAEDLRAAVEATLNEEPVANPVTKTFGCSTKWAWKAEAAKQTEQAWQERPVTLEMISAEGIKDLVANESDKLRLINVWATWCGPCIIEYPELIIINRMYMGRDFEFISVSADDPDNFDDVLEFLTSRYSAIQNYLYDSDDKYALIDAIDPEWDGALPYSLLIEPGGNKVYAAQGAVDLMELKKTIVENPLIGRYFTTPRAYLEPPEQAEE